MKYECDVLVVGGGGAAVRAAVEAAQPGVKVILVDKGSFERSGTSPLSLHGFATVLHEQSSEALLTEDISRTGSNVADQDLVRLAANESRFEPARLEAMGVKFVRLENGEYDIYRGAGHTAPHGLTFDDSGNLINFCAVLGKVAWKRGVQLVEEVIITDILVDDGRVVGALGVDAKGEQYTFAAKAVVLAAGGANRIYHNVVPRIADPMFRTTGDGYILALRAGVPLVDMEFANFRDTPPAARLQARYVNAKGEYLMEKYDPERLERAPRGNVVEALYLEMQAGNAPIHIEITPESERIAQFMPSEYKNYVRAYKEGKRPPVTITFQRLLGGARINPDASTVVQGLYAAGENAGGFHGGDRLMGAAFLETQVYGRLAGLSAAEYSRNVKASVIPAGMAEKAFARMAPYFERREGVPAAEYLKQVHKLTWDYASIVRSAEGLNFALAEIAKVRKGIAENAYSSNIYDILEVENLAYTAEVVMRAAMAREETRATHRRSDFPAKNDALKMKHTSITVDSEGRLSVEIVPSRP